MESSSLFLFFPLILLLWVWARGSRSVKRSPLLPPGPAPWPIVGNLLELGAKPHRSLAGLAATHGPLLRLQLGLRTTVVVSSPAVTREMMLRHDAAFAGRSLQDVATVLGHHHASVVFLPPGPRWRFLRKICSSNVFANSRLEAEAKARREKLRQLVSHLEKCSKAGKAVNIGQVAFTTILNILSNTFFSIDMVDLSSVEYGHEFKELIWAMMVVAGTPNIADFFPMLKLVDPLGIRKRSEALVLRTFAIFDDIIERKMKTRNNSIGMSSVEDKDVVDRLLTLSQKDDVNFGRHDILHFLLDLFAAGTDTTSSTIEWAMTELIRNPDKLKKAQSEIKKIVGKGIPFEESHSTQLPYLQAVIKETLRMHPPVPFLVPRNVESDVELCGYSIPKGSQVLVNVWAMGRDGNTWQNPDSFEPERFFGSELDYKGHHSELLPFGFGRRICPGLPLASRVLVLVLGSMVHSFDWMLPDGIRSADIDVDDKFGFTLQKAQPLYVVPVAPK